MGEVKTDIRNKIVFLLDDLINKKPDNKVCLSYEQRSIVIWMLEDKLMLTYTENPDADAETSVVDVGHLDSVIDYILDDMDWYPGKEFIVQYHVVNKHSFRAVHVDEFWSWEKVNVDS